MNCEYCKEETGTKLLCRRCQKSLSKAQLKRIQIMWHKIIIEQGREDDMFRCSLCKKLFPENMVCGDHHPYTKGSHPELKFDVNNGRIVCAPCNDNQSPHR